MRPHFEYEEQNKIYFKIITRKSRILWSEERIFEVEFKGVIVIIQSF